MDGTGQFNSPLRNNGNQFVSPFSNNGRRLSNFIFPQSTNNDSTRIAVTPGEGAPSANTSTTSRTSDPVSDDCNDSSLLEGDTIDMNGAKRARTMESSAVNDQSVSHDTNNSLDHREEPVQEETPHSTAGSTAMLRKLFKTVIRDAQEPPKNSYPNQFIMSDLSAEDEQQEQIESIKKPIYDSTKNLFGSKALDGLPKEIIMSHHAVNKKRKLDMGIKKFRLKPISGKGKKINGLSKPFPSGVPSTSQWRVFFKAMDEVKCKMLWKQGQHDKVLRCIHKILKFIMLETYSTTSEMTESNVFNMRQVFYVWYTTVFMQEKGPFEKIKVGTRKGRGLLYTDDEVIALDAGMYMYPDTVPNRFYQIRNEEMFSDIFQNIRTPYHLYDKARSPNLDRPWEQLFLFYELQEILTQETIAEIRNMNETGDR